MRIETPCSTVPKVKRQGEVLVLIHILVLIVHGGGEPLPETEEEQPEGESNNILLITQGRIIVS